MFQWVRCHSLEFTIFCWTFTRYKNAVIFFLKLSCTCARLTPLPLLSHYVTHSSTSSSPTCGLRLWTNPNSELFCPKWSVCYQLNRRTEIILQVYAWANIYTHEFLFWSLKPVGEYKRKRKNIKAVRLHI